MSSNNNSTVREKIHRFNMLAKVNDGFLLEPIKQQNKTHSLSSISSRSPSTMSEYITISNECQQEKNSSTHTSTATINLQTNIDWKRSSTPSKSHINDENIELTSCPVYASPAIIHQELQIITTNDSNDIGLEVIEPIQIHENLKSQVSNIEHYGENDIEHQSSDLNINVSLPPLRLPPPPPPSVVALAHLQEESNNQFKRFLPLSTFLFEGTALFIVFMLCMVLVLAIRENQATLQTIMQVFYTYIYLVSIVWMIWCTYDIIKFRQQWMILTSSAHDQEEYMDVVEHYSHRISYFPDRHKTGGLFMRIGAGLLCMGSLLLTLIELAKSIEILRTISIHRQAVPKAVLIAKSIMFIFRFIFHCLQFTFLFRYGNIIINRYHFIAKMGLIHIVIANFCTWFEAIVIETLEQLHKHSNDKITTNIPLILESTSSQSVEMTTVSHISFNTNNFLRDIFVTDSIRASTSDASHNTSTNILEFIEKIESTMGSYLYPCLIEYSLICVTVFYIMWRNVNKTENRSFLHFGDRHIFTVNCSRASHGLLIGGIILLLTILTLIPAYILDATPAILITHITELVLLVVSLLIVCISFFYTTKLYYDPQAHVDIFDQILILVTTVGEFAYSFFGLFASIFIETYTIEIPRAIEIAISLLAIFQTFFQSAFILDTLKRRITTKNELRKKPGRQLITALLLINLAIWMHDSLSAKKVQLNPIQTDYYDESTWSIIQAFTSPLSIFYRFHSSVCLADIWQEVYHDHGTIRTDRLTNSNNNHH